MPFSSCDDHADGTSSTAARRDKTGGESAAFVAPRRGCRAVLLTAHGRGALATIVVEGPGACAALRTCFRPATPQPDVELPRDRILFGHWQLNDTPGSASAGDGEELVVCQLASDRLEIHCHGGRAVVAQVLASLQRAGCTIVSSARWLLSRESDRLRAEAQLALGQAGTLRVAGVLLDQHRGALSQAVARIHQALRAGETDTAATLLRTLLGWAPVGLHLTRPWRIVIVGRANVGKSSLLNAVLGYSRALVHPTPGTTRDVLTASTAIDGWPVEFADTAGSRAGAGELERAGVQRAAEHATRADLILLVSDLSAPWTTDDQHLLARATDLPLVVHNKSDLVDRPPSSRPDGIVTCAKTAAGVPQLLAAISERLVPATPSSGTPMPFRQTHVRHLRRALQALTSGHRDQAIQSLRALSENRMNDHGSLPDGHAGAMR